MGRLASLAKAPSSKLKGAVTVTRLDGTTRTFASEAEAEKALDGVTLEHRRGAFFEVAKAEPASTSGAAKDSKKK